MIGRWGDHHRLGYPAMTRLNDNYVVNDNGPRPGVCHDTDDYAKVLEKLEAICAYDAAKSSGEEIIRSEEAIEEIERERG